MVNEANPMADYETVKGLLLRKSLEELYVLRGEQYADKEALVEDIMAHDDGSIVELLEWEGSFLYLLMGRKAGSGD